MVEYFIDTQQVSVRYSDEQKVTRTVLNDINLRVRRGELVTVVGPSGCGKSTLLRLLLGAQFPTDGNVLVDGNRVENVSRDCGIVYQSYSLFPHLSVLDNICFGLVLEQTNLWQGFAGFPFAVMERILTSTGIPKALGFVPFIKARREAREQAYEFLDGIGLDRGDALKFPHELSGGMRQRVAIAQAVIMKPKILLMDEPFGALDQNRREEMQDFIFEQWLKHKLTVFFVTHDLDEAVRLGTRLICLSQYWTDPRKYPGQGAKIVVDKKVLGGTEKPSTFAGSDEFKALIREIGQIGLNSKRDDAVSRFDLSHPDAIAYDPGTINS